ncbi:MAG: hypothetical protein A2046_16215 [Bacteroidetes bacterium GWA2_30_7]|nr:MAG: hypothetical protein A2046_16215 [Bacteroidetes bacterium GWA2_30_7]
MKKINLILLFVSVLFSACNNEPVKINKSEYNEPLIRVNKYLVGKDDEIIKSYAKRHNWNINITGSGLYYEISHVGNGDSAKSGMTVSLKYKLSLINGTVCYDSDSTGLKTFTIGRGEVENGLDMGIQMMRIGDKAKFILPPHLAFGILGDGKKIPARAIIIYNIEIVEKKI